MSVNGLRAPSSTLKGLLRENCIPVLSQTFEGKNGGTDLVMDDDDDDESSDVWYQFVEEEGTLQQKRLGIVRKLSDQGQTAAEV